MGLDASIIVVLISLKLMLTLLRFKGILFMWFLLSS